MAIFSTLQDKNPYTDQSKNLHTDYVGGTTKWAEIHDHQLGVADPHMGDVVNRQCFFPVVSQASAQPTTSTRVPHQSTRFRPRMLGGLIDSPHPMVELSPKTLILDSNGDFQLKRLWANLGKEEKHHNA
jgi:hypothetical protein